MKTKTKTIWTRPVFTPSPRQLGGTHAVLQILDCMTTLFLVAHLTTKVEANPAMRHILNAPGGMGILAAVKFLAAAGFYVLIPWLLKHDPTCAWVWRVLAIFYFAVVLNNLMYVAIVCMQS